MPFFDEIEEYCRDATVTAFQDYYEFLKTMYLSDADIVEPPPSGWPALKSRMQDLGKSEELSYLLSHLPYIRGGRSDERPMGGPDMYFANWQGLEACARDNSRLGGFKFPPHMIQLSSASPWQSEIVILDIGRAVIYWVQCPEQVRLHSSREMILDDAYDYCDTEEEANWIYESGVWAIRDFFQMLKDQFRHLHFLPTTARKVIGDYGTRVPPMGDMILATREIYREHGWPDVDRFDKAACLESLKTRLRERFPTIEQHYSDIS